MKSVSFKNSVLLIIVAPRPRNRFRWVVDNSTHYRVQNR